MLMLKDSKVILRAVEPEDLELMYLLENDESLWDTSSTTVPYSAHLLKEYIKECSCNFYKDGAVRLAIALPSGIAVGFINLQNYDPQHQRAEVGIVVMREFHRMGLARHSLLIMGEYAKDVLHLHQLYAYVQSDNVAARHLFHSVGYIEAGMLKHWTHCVAGWKDTVVYQLLFAK